MPTKCPHSSHPSKLQDRTSARFLTSPFHGGAESRVQIPELRVPMSPQMPHGPLSKHAAPRLRAALCRVQSTITWLLISGLPCVEDTLSFTWYQPHISGLPCVEDTLSFTWYQPHISGCRVLEDTDLYSHDTSPTSAAAVCRGLLSHSFKVKWSPCFSRSPTRQ